MSIKVSNVKFYENPVAAELIHAFRWKVMTKQIGAFDDYTKTRLRMSLFVS